MIVKLLKQSGQSAVVSFWDNETGMIEAKIISLKELPIGLRIGQEADISKDVVTTGTDYGIEWGLLLGETVPFLTDSMRNHGIWTEEDLRKKPSQVIAAVTGSSARIYAELLRLVDRL